MIYDYEYDNGDCPTHFTNYLTSLDEMGQFICFVNAQKTC